MPFMFTAYTWAHVRIAVFAYCEIKVTNQLCNCAADQRLCFWLRLKDLCILLYFKTLTLIFKHSLETITSHFQENNISTLSF